MWSIWPTRLTKLPAEGSVCYFSLHLKFHTWINLRQMGKPWRGAVGYWVADSLGRDQKLLPSDICPLVRKGKLGVEVQFLVDRCLKPGAILASSTLGEVIADRQGLFQRGDQTAFPSGAGWWPPAGQGRGSVTGDRGQAPGVKTFSVAATLFYSEPSSSAP